MKERRFYEFQTHRVSNQEISEEKRKMWLMDPLKSKYLNWQEIYDDGKFKLYRKLVYKDTR